MVYSREKKSIFKKKKNADSSPVKAHDSSKLELSVPGKDEKKFSPKLSKKSFRKVAKMVKLSSGVKKSHKKSEATKNEEEEEVDVGEQGVESSSEEALSPPLSLAKEDASDQLDGSDGPQRPSDITLRQTSMTETPLSSTPSSAATSSGSRAHVQRSSSSSSDDFVHVPLPPKGATSDESSKGRSKTSQTQKTPTLPKLSESREILSSPPPTFSTHSPTQVEGEGEFFSINEMHLCICGQWLCVSNSGGMVMAFDFRLKSKKSPKVRISSAHGMTNTLCMYV